MIIYVDVLSAGVRKYSASSVRHGTPVYGCLTAEELPPGCTKS